MPQQELTHNQIPNAWEAVQEEYIVQAKRYTATLVGRGIVLVSTTLFLDWCMRTLASMLYGLGWNDFASIERATRLVDLMKNHGINVTDGHVRLARQAVTGAQTGTAEYLFYGYLLYHAMVDGESRVYGSDLEEPALLRIEMIPLSRSRTQVSVYCVESAILPAAEACLRAMAEAFPEADFLTHGEQSEPDQTFAAGTDEPRESGLGHQSSGHYAYPPERRKEIVSSYREAHARGEIENTNAWAQSRYGISGKTLKRYVKEFPDAET